MKTKKICPGYYSFEYKGVTGSITKIEGENNWYYQLGSDGSVDDWHPSKKDAILAAIEYIDLYHKA